MLPFAALAAAVFGALAIASADRARRLMWSAAAAASVGLAAGGIAGDLFLLSFDLRHAGPLDDVRAALAAPLVRFIPEPEAGLVLGIVLGERTSIGSSLTAAFNATGTTHLLAISGFNLTLVAAAVALLARGRLPLVPAASLGLAVTLAYSLIVGFQPSVLRAVLMATLGALAVITGRRAVAINALCAAVVAMLLLDPLTVVDIGALLSVGATAGLILWQRPLAERLAFLPALVGEGLAATLAASIPTLPLIAAIFGRVSLVSPLANLVAVPLFTPLLAAGAATSLVGALLPEAARPFALAAYVCAALLRLTVEAFAAIPGASVVLPAGLLTGLFMTVAIAAAVTLAVRGGVDLAGIQSALHALVVRVAPTALPVTVPLRPAALIGAVTLALLGGALLLPRLASPAPSVRVLALDVGQGDAFLIETADGHLALIDGGPDPARLLAELGATLPPWRRRIDLIALTHAHLDHGAGLLAVLDRYEVGLAIEPAGLNAGPLRDQWIARSDRAGVPRRAVRAGDRVRFGSAVLRVLSPNVDTTTVDVPSLVLRLEREGFSALFTGDATDAALADLLLEPEKLRAQVYVPPHHGAETPFAAALVGAVRPHVAILSLGAGNRYGHPTPETLGALDRVRTLRTDRDGTIEARAEGGGVVVRAHANGLPPPRRGVVPYAPAPVGR